MTGGPRSHRSSLIAHCYTPPTRPTRILLLLLPLAFAAGAFADPEPRWKSIVVRFTLTHDGSVRVSEQLIMDVGPGIDVVERRYWNDAKQHVTVQKLLRVEDDGRQVAVPFETPQAGAVRWKVTPGESQTFLLESTVEGVVNPAWSIPRGRLSHDARGIDDPRDRLRELIPIWREALQKPRTRCLLDVEYEMPPPTEDGMSIQLQLYWDDGWTPVHPIAPDTIARKTEHDTFNSTRWRVTHLFDYVGSVGTPVDFRPNLQLMGAIVGFPILALLIWIAFFLRELLRRGGAAGGDVDERVLNETLFNEAPEVIAARWSGEAQRPRIEPFLRRLEKLGKVSVAVEPARDGDDDEVVSVRLLVPREQLGSYERMGIDLLMPNRWEVSSGDLRKARGDRDDDALHPADALFFALLAIVSQGGAKRGAPWYSKVTSFALFVFGGYLLLGDTVKYHREPILFFVGLVVASALSSMFPDSLARSLIRDRLAWTLLLFIPLLLATAAIVILHLVLPMPAGAEASAGLTLMLLGVYKATVAASATHEPRAARRRRAELLRVRNWLRAELRNPHPRLRDDWLPWLLALGLHRDVERWRGRAAVEHSGFATSGWTGVLREEKESWGESLVA
jgi:hypothetical protein